MSKRISVLMLSLTTLLLACGGQNAMRQRAKVRGIEVCMTELAKDGDYEIYPDERFRKVDLNSTLRLDFKPPLKPEEVESSPRWIRLAEILKQLNINVVEHERLARRASVLMINENEPFDPVFIADVDSLNNKALRLLKELVKPGDSILSREEFNQLIIRGFEEPYRALSEALNNKRDELHQTAAQFITDNEHFEVVLRAFMLPQEGGRQALHIPGYDKLPQGEFNQVNPMALLPSPKETQRLKTELKAAKNVASSIDEIRDNGKSIQESMQNAIPELRENVQQLINGLQSDLFNSLPASWKNMFNDPFLTQVAQVQTPGNESDQLSSSLRQIGTDLEKLEAVIPKLENFRIQVIAFTKPEEIKFSRLKVTVDGINSMIESIGIVLDGLRKWPDHFSRIDKTSPIVAAAATNAALQKNLDEFKTKVHEILKTTRAGLLAKLPHTRDAIDLFIRFYRDANGILELGSQEPPYIPRPLDKLQTAELDLRYSGIIEGDRVEVTFDMRPKGEQISNEMLSNQSVTYQAEATFAGWHRRLDGNVILSRTIVKTEGNAFRPNTSVSLEFHKFTRPNNNWFWNDLDFGLGFHAAFLDHDPDENIEMGGGVNISILDGLLRTGIGYNISADKDNGYWFIGFGLFSILNQLGEVNKIVF